MDAGRPYRTAFIFDHPEDLVPVLSRLFQPLALFLERGWESAAEPRGDLHVLEPGDHHLGLLDAGRSQLELAALDDWSVHDACTNPSVVRQKFVEQIVAGTRKGGGPMAEAKKGVALGGAHLKMRDDDGPPDTGIGRRSCNMPANS